MNYRFHLTTILVFFIVLALGTSLFSQGQFFPPPPEVPGQIPPHFEQGRNMAIASRINGQASGFEPVRIISTNQQNGNRDTTYLLITPDYYGYGLFNVNNPSAPIKLGKILVDSVGGVIDVESIFERES